MPKDKGLWITIDGWTALNGQSYLGVIVHYLSSSFQPMTFLLTTIPTNNHDSTSVASELSAVLKNWQFENNIRGMVGDNTRAVPKTAQLIADDVDFEEFQFWGCIAHLLNLVVKHSLEEVHQQRNLCCSNCNSTELLH